MAFWANLWRCRYLNILVDRRKDSIEGKIEAKKRPDRGARRRNMVTQLEVVHINASSSLSARKGHILSWDRFSLWYIEF